MNFRYGGAKWGTCHSRFLRNSFFQPKRQKKLAERKKARIWEPVFFILFFFCKRFWNDQTQRPSRLLYTYVHTYARKPTHPYPPATSHPSFDGAPSPSMRRGTKWADMVVFAFKLERMSCQRMLLSEAPLFACEYESRLHGKSKVNEPSGQGANLSCHHHHNHHHRCSTVNGLQ